MIALLFLLLILMNFVSPLLTFSPRLDVVASISDVFFLHLVWLYARK